MSKEIYISSTPHETRLAIVEDDNLTEIYYERENEYTLAGSVYNGKVTRVLPGMQSAFVDIGLERDAFLYITDFMEEVPDSAEFETSSNADTRPARLGSGEPPSSPARDDRGGRARRGGRDRNRGERGDSPVRRDDPERGEAPPPAQLGGTDDDSSYAGEAMAEPRLPAATDSLASDPAAPADGSRRWRGRRGRRRGRGPGQPGEPGTETGAEHEAPAEPFESAPKEDDAAYDLGAAAEAPPEATATGSAAPPQGGRREGRRGRFDRNRRSREDRPDASGTEPHSSDSADARAQRFPRGFSPSRNLYGVDEAESGAIPLGEPIVLPGESLSKYRKAGEQPTGSASASTSTTPAASVSLARPANLIEVAEGWDGSDVLPGETLSRRRSSAPAEASARVGDGRRPSRFERAPRREQQPAPTPPPPGLEPPHNTPEADKQAHLETGLEPTPAWSADAVPTPEPLAHEEGESVASITAAPEPVDYEPTDATASHRVDPVSPAEFRQSSPVLEPTSFEPSSVESPSEPDAQAQPRFEPAHLEAVGASSLEPHGSIAHTITPLTPEPQTARAFAAEPDADAAPATHEITSVSPAGEMHSHLPPADLQAEAPATAPLAEPMDHAPAGIFSPGDGPIDEELLDDEEPGGTIHASTFEELDDLEEETLEGAADLGTMLREMSIDHITRVSPDAGDESEDDFEEDDLEDDFEEEATLEQNQEETALHEHDSLDEDAEDDMVIAEGGSDDAFGPADHGAYDAGSVPSIAPYEPRRDDSRDQGTRDADRRPRRDGRRDGRRGDRGSRSSSGGDRGTNNRSRHSVQSTNLPAISDLLKPGQEILVQIAKEPIAKKGARITSHIALPGRFLVFMPTVNHTGVSRKIESDTERRRLKDILLSEKGEASGGFIVRTAAAGATEEELRSDLRFLLNLWSDIKARSESSKSPALIYHDLNLIERILRDQVTDTFSAIWVDSETEYERVLRFLQRFQPSLIRRVKLYTKDMPLFEQFGITEEINKALRSKVWLKSGGSIVINQTEALVAIDINTGKYVGKTARLEDTIVKTNLDAIPEIVRQIRLRDLGGIIIIDFIDMDERKNRNRVMAALEEELKSDRAPSKVLQFNDFGLVAITRKRVKQSLERTLSTPCTICAGTGMVKSPVTVCNDIYVEMRKMHKHLDRGDVMLRVHPDVVKQLKSSGSRWLHEMEEMAGKTILVKSDPGLHPEQFDIH